MAPRSLNLRRLLLVYISAVLALVVTVATSTLVTELEAKHLRADAAIINLSGRQRMLSQRILYLAQGLVLGDAAETQTGQRDQARIIRELENSIARFETNSALVTIGAGTNDRVRDAYFDAAAGPSLRDRVTDYIESARGIVEDPTDANLLRRLRQIESDGLLADLDTVVQLFEATSNVRISFLRAVERFMLAIAILLVLAEYTFVLLPGHRAIKQTISAVHIRNGALNDARLMLRDINRDLVSQNAEILRARDLLSDALKQSENLRREQSEFTYAVSHDLKSPANTIQLLLNELRLDHYDAMDDDGKYMLNTAEGTVRRMSRLIEDVLTYSWVTDEGAKPEAFDMGATLKNVVTDLASEIRDADAQVFLGKGITVIGYPTQLRILAQNLISNAIKFRAAGVRPNVRVSCQPIDTNGTWRLVVQDNGIGIPLEHQTRIFELFQRLHVRESYPGSGLGLATCQRIVANHGGSVTIVSAPGAGSTFEITLRLPAALSAPAPLQNGAAACTSSDDDRVANEARAA